MTDTERQELLDSAIESLKKLETLETSVESKSMIFDALSTLCSIGSRSRKRGLEDETAQKPASKRTKSLLTAKDYTPVVLENGKKFSCSQTRGLVVVVVGLDQADPELGCAISQCTARKLCQPPVTQILFNNKIPTENTLKGQLSVLVALIKTGKYYLYRQKNDETSMVVTHKKKTRILVGLKRVDQIPENAQKMTFPSLYHHQITSEWYFCQRNKMQILSIV
jgi:hypothetical protein